MTQLAENLWYDRWFLCHDSPLSLLKGCDKTEGYFLMIILKETDGYYVMVIHSCYYKVVIRQVVISHDNRLSLLNGCGKSIGYFVMIIHSVYGKVVVRQMAVISWESTQPTENLFTLLNDCGFYLFNKWNELSVFCVNGGRSSTFGENN